MIISHTYRFAFIHIPKCAGTTVRNPLQIFDDTNGVYTRRVAEHPVLGNLDYVHIPLFGLKKYFEKEFMSVTDYWSFSIVRDPYARFASSVSQRLKMYSDLPIHKCGLTEVRKAIEESIDYLLQQPTNNHLLPPEYIHFQKQIDYIELNGEQIVESLYTVNDVNLLLKDVEQRIGQTLGEGSRTANSVPRANQSVVFRNNALRWMFETARPVTNKVGLLLPDRFKQGIRDKVYVPRDQRMKDLFTKDYVQDFIREYYAEDIALCEKVDNRLQAKAQ
jgi:hypothetical protein